MPRLLSEDTVDHFENKEDPGKVVKHMQDFLTVLDEQKAATVFAARDAGSAVAVIATERSAPGWWLVPPTTAPSAEGTAIRATAACTEQGRFAAKLRSPMLAKKINASTTALPTSHIPMHSRPKDVAAVILAAAERGVQASK